MNAVDALVAYALKTGLIEACEEVWARNSILDALGCDALPEVEVAKDAPLAAILDALTDFKLPEASIVYRDLFDTELMGRLTPRPGQVAARFNALRSWKPEAATDWYYRFSQNTNYIRRDRIARDVQWKAHTEYGDLDIT
ncbi:MAG: UDP-glucose--hexose-1-phosphate uridylyltransferase, partial [bacterium]